MLAVAGSPSVLQSIPSDISSRAEIACVDSPREILLVSDKHVIDQLKSHFVACGLRCTKIPVPFAFHSAQVDHILDDLEKILSLSRLPGTMKTVYYAYMRVWMDQAPHKARLDYVSISLDQETEIEHATCVVEFEVPEKWLQRWIHEFNLI